MFITLFVALRALSSQTPRPLLFYDTLAKATWWAVPGARRIVPEARCNLLWAWWTFPGARWTVPGAWWTFPGARWTVPGARWTFPGARWTVPGAGWTVPWARWNLPGRNPTPETRIPLPLRHN
jgi:hypothetical protein